MKKHLKKPAFSLVEMILYIAIVSFVTVSILLFNIQILEANGGAKEDREVLENARFVMNKITDEIRHADSLDSGTGTFSSNPGAFKLNTNGTGSIVFDTATKNVTIGENDYPIRYLRINEDDTGFKQITSDRVNVTNFTVINLQRDTEPANIQFSLGFESINQEASINLQSSSTIRR
ncbi:type II secretion system GspH family protein [Patescibacteria group bacterium]|nr:type II secretion system GspH family protein [Patescibacteria group bacterium]